MSALWAAALGLAVFGSAAAPASPLDAAMQQDNGPDRTLLDDSAGAPLKNRAGSSARAPGWLRQSASLLYFDEQGGLVSELPLRSDEETAGPGRVNIHEILGNASPNRRFAWTLERTLTWTQDHSKLLASKRLLRLYGANGKELWSSQDADTPETGEPLLFSADGETLMLASRGTAGWTAAVKNYLGATLAEVTGAPRLQTMWLSPSGKYAYARWVVPDQSATHSFFEAATKLRHDTASSEFALSPALMSEDGKVYSGKRLVFDFAALRPKP